MAASPDDKLEVRMSTLGCPPGVEEWHWEHLIVVHDDPLLARIVGWKLIPDSTGRLLQVAILQYQNEGFEIVKRALSGGDYSEPDPDEAWRG